MIKKIFFYGFSIFFNRIFGLLPLKKNRVLFLSDVRDDLSGNFEFIYREIAADYEIKTSLKADRRIRHSFGDYIKQCLWLATSEYVLLDDFAECTAFMHVRKGQQLVQLWHGSGAYKKFAYSREGEKNIRIHPGYKRYTKAIVSSEFTRSCYVEAFRIPADRIAVTGIPKTDIFFDEDYKAEKRAEFFRNFPGASGKKIILFAPTYRGTRVEDAGYSFDSLNLEKIYEALHDDYVLLIKWHPALFNNIRLGKVKEYDPEQYRNFVYDVSQSREVNDFMFAADILVTDYSSIIFDYALLEKPIIYFAYDLEEYENGRGLYCPFNEYIYGKIAKNTDELISALKEAKIYEDKLRLFTDKFIKANDGRATERVVEFVFGDA